MKRTAYSVGTYCLIATYTTVDNVRSTLLAHAIHCPGCDDLNSLQGKVGQCKPDISFENCRHATPAHSRGRPSAVAPLSEAHTILVIG